MSESSMPAVQHTHKPLLLLRKTTLLIKGLLNQWFIMLVGQSLATKHIQDQIIFPGV